LAEEGLAELRVKLGTPTIQRTYDPDQGSWRGWAGAILKNEIMNLRRKRACRKFRLSKQALRDLRKRGVPDDVCGKLGTAVGKTFYGEGSFRKRLGALLSPDEYDHHAEVIVQHALRERRQEPADAARSRERPPLGQAALPELARDIDAGLDQLDEDELIIFILRQFLGWTFARIAELLFGNPNPNLVAATYYRALQKMKHWLSDWGYSEDDLS
jgi:RNA polymerase sigma factor (sigma-70 family)